MPETENVLGGIMVAAMGRTTMRANPFSYTKATQSTRAASFKAARASDRGISLIHFEQSSSPPKGFY